MAINARPPCLRGAGRRRLPSRAAVAPARPARRAGASGLPSRTMPWMPELMSPIDTVWPSACRPGPRSFTELPLSSDVVAVVCAPKLPRSMACWMFRFQSMIPISVFTTYWMMLLPPGEPRIAYEAPLAVEHDRGRHRAARPLAGLHAVRNRPARGIVRREAEVGQLVVEQESAHHLVAAEAAFDRRRHRHRVALAHRRSTCGSCRSRNPPAARLAPDCRTRRRIRRTGTPMLL